MHQAGHLDQAALLYRKVLAAEPNNANSLHLLGMIAYQTGQPAAAADLIAKAIALHGGEASFHFHLALALKALGKFDEAVAHYRRALVLKPNDADTYNNLGNVQAEAGRFDEATASYRQALALAPDNAKALNNLGSTLLELGHADEAETNYRKAIALEPDYADAHNNLGNIFRDKGDLDQAMACYRKTLALTPHHLAALNNLGITLWNMGQRDEAMASYRRTLALDPDHVEALGNLAIALWESGALDDAEAAYRRIHALRPGDPNLLNDFAALLLARGRAGEAMELIRQSLAIRETGRAKKLFVELARQSGWTSSNDAIRAVLVRALSEPWDRPARLSQTSADLIKRNPALAPMVARANTAWPRRLKADELLDGNGFAPLADDALLIALLTCAPNTDMALERFLTMVRGVVLAAAMDGGNDSDDGTVLFCGALAQQCFINEYVFLPAAEEWTAAQTLRAAVSAALDAGTPISILQLLAVAAYFPLHEIPAAAGLPARQWPAPVLAVLTQQIREPREEARLAAEIPRLTKIRDEVSRRVQSQYEENPYPRWVRIAPGSQDTIARFLGNKFPLVAFSRPPRRPDDDGFPGGGLRHRPALHFHGAEIRRCGNAGGGFKCGQPGLCQTQIAGPRP